MPETAVIGIKLVPDGLVVDDDFLSFTLCKDDATIIIILVARSIILIVIGGGKNPSVQLTLNQLEFPFLYDTLRSYFSFVHQ
jgi:hypothetical protein